MTVIKIKTKKNLLILLPNIEWMEKKWLFKNITPQSSGKVERANSLLKDQLTKLSLELNQSWTSLLPLALTRLRAIP